MYKTRALLLLVVLLISGCTIQPQNVSLPQSVQLPNGCSLNFNEAVESQDVLLCDVVTDKTPRESQNPFYANKCRENCIRAISYEKGDPALCGLISDIDKTVNSSLEDERVDGWPNLKRAGFSIKDNCYKQLAEKMGDISLCAKSETEYGVETCFQLVEATLRREGRLVELPKTY